MSEWADDVVPEPDTDEADIAADEAPELYYGSVDEFVREFLVPTFRRKISERGSNRWDPEWWRHPEAVLRLEALWRSWEHLRLDPATGMSVWLRDHLDHHLAVLLSSDGPFGNSETSSRLGDELPYTAPPSGTYPDVRSARADS